MRAQEAEARQAVKAAATLWRALQRNAAARRAAVARRERALHAAADAEAAAIRAYLAAAPQEIAEVRCASQPRLGAVLTQARGCRFAPCLTSLTRMAAGAWTLRSCKS